MKVLNVLVLKRLQDGMAISGAVLHQLATHTLSLSFFATHYGTLTDDYAYHPNVRNMHMETLVDDEKREVRSCVLSDASLSPSANLSAF